ncbi:methyl-accepting chemotaxis protein [Maricaulis sp.]|uniref:methyl-accepting chemotaxis protein n=1 Tax=Maricaulis sp. TaxID=1486257 RepID=UPI0025C3B321|nr:methyl-accepting chemotaxis protein [Maricaulis sp.]
MPQHNRIENWTTDAQGARSPFSRLLLGTIESANRILLDTTQDVEDQARRLSDLFTSLNDGSEEQTQRLSKLVSQITTVEHEGKSIDLITLPQILQASLSEVTERILVLSKQGVSLIYSLDDILCEMDGLGACINEIEAINKQTRLLSLNAQIESARAGAAGAGFQIVSTEMHTLSKRIDALSDRMRGSTRTVTESIREVVGSIRSEYRELSEIGAMDLSKQIDAKEHLEVLLTSLVERNAEISVALSDSTSTSRRIGDEVREVVIAMQFQDRMRQRTEAVVTALTAVSRFLSDHPEKISDPETCDGLVQTIVDSISLSDVRRQFEIGLRGKPSDDAPAPAPAPAESTIELF